MKRYLLIAITSLALLASCGNNQSNKTAEHDEHHHGQEGTVELSAQQREALNLRLGTFQMKNLTTLVKTNGQLEVPPAASAEVSAMIGGNVKEIKVFHGDKVQKGQVLAILEHPDYVILQEEFAEVANQLEFLEQEYKRQKELFENEVGAGKDFQKVKSDYNIMKAKYAGLKSRLKLLGFSCDEVQNGCILNTIKLTSPISGYVNDIDIKVGSYADAQRKLFEITDNSEIHADFMVYEKDVFLLKNGQKVDFTVANRPGEELSATIFAIGKEFEANTRAVHIHAVLDSNPGNLIPGMYVSGHIHTDEESVKALPNDALVTDGTRSYIFVLNDSEHHHEHDAHASGGEEHDHHPDADEMTFRRVEVVPGKTDGGYTEVKLLEPLEDDIQIVLNEAYYLLADMKKEETEHHH